MPSTLAWSLGLLLLAAGCSTQPVPADDDDTDGDDDAGDDDAGDDDAGDDDACADYRAEYPAGPYGNTVGSVVEDFPGMRDGEGVFRSLEEIFADTSVVALVVANAFDT